MSRTFKRRGDIKHKRLTAYNRDNKWEEELDKVEYKPKSKTKKIKVTLQFPKSLTSQYIYYYIYYIYYTSIY